MKNGRILKILIKRFTEERTFSKINGRGLILNWLSKKNEAASTCDEK